MDFGDVVKMIGAALSIITAAKITYELSLGGKAKLREEYRFAKEFLRDFSQEPKLHPLAIERGLYAIAGTSTIKSKEIEYVISLENSDRCLKDYVLSRKYLEHLGEHGVTRIEFSKKYKRKWFRSLWLVIHMLVYVSSAFAAVSPLLFHPLLEMQPKQAFIASLFTVPSFGFLAFESLWSFIKIKRAEVLVGSQRKHSTPILLDGKMREG